MKQSTKSHHFNLEKEADLKKQLQEMNLHLPHSPHLGILTSPLKMGGFILPNRFLIQPMEGVDAHPETGAPSPLTVRRYRRYAAGGSGLIWGEAVSVVPEGCSGARQLRLTQSNLKEYQKLVETIRQEAYKHHNHSIVLILQLTHSGRYSRPNGIPKPLKGQKNPWLDDVLKMNEAPIITDEELDHLLDAYVETAQLAFQAGFDGVDVKAVHGYLIAELLGAHSRTGRYGGSFENRTRFLRECIARIKDLCPSSHFVTSRTTVLEPTPYPYGWGVAPTEGESKADWTMDLEEPLQLLREMDVLGLPIVNISMGFPRFQPHINRPASGTAIGALPPPEHPLKGLVRYQETVKEIQLNLPNLPIPNAALAWLRHLMPEVAAGMIEEGWCSLFGMGRGAFAYPDLPRDVMRQGFASPEKCCTTCSMCSQIMKDGIGRTGCVIRDKAIYGPELARGRSVQTNPALIRNA